MPSKQCGNPLCTKAAGSTSLKACSRCKKVSYCSRECQTTAWSTHSTSCRRPNYIIKFHLSPEDITSPEVVRTLSCPADANFYRLHMALQVAFGWGTMHSFDFAVKDPSYKPSDDVMELIQRKMTAQTSGGMNPASAAREYLIRVVDPVKSTKFSGIDRMHEGERRHVGTAERSADKYKLYQLFDNALFQGHDIIYTYDFGDNWEHYLTVTGRADATDGFVCLDGSGHGVAEDVGSFRGWSKLKDCYRTTNPSAEQKQRRSWYENQANNCDPRGLAGDRVNFWDRNLVNKHLARVSTMKMDY